MAYLGNSPINRLYSAQAIVLSQGQTAVNVNYTPGLTLFFRDGALLEPGTDYTAPDGSVVTLAKPANAGDVLQVVSLAQFAVAGALALSGGTMGGPLNVQAAKTAAQAAQFGQVSGVVGQSRNLVMSVTTASATATLTADEIIVESALGGLRYCLSNFNETINLATTGAGGMDTGTAPASGFVAIYAIYNPTTDAMALLGTDATSALAPHVYGGANMPSGYTASALVSVWKTNASRQFVAGFQRNRKVSFSAVAILSTTSLVGTLTALSISTVAPLNATSLDVQGTVANVASGLNSAALWVASLGSGVGNTEVVSAGGNNPALTSLSGNTPGIPVITPQTLYYMTQGAGSTVITFNLFCNAYTF